MNGPLTVYRAKIFKHELETSSSITLVSIQVLKVDRRPMTFFKPIFVDKEI